MTKEIKIEYDECIICGDYLYPVDDDGVCEFCKKEYESENTTEITKLIYRRKLAGFDAPLKHLSGYTLLVRDMKIYYHGMILESE